MISASVKKSRSRTFIGCSGLLAGSVQRVQVEDFRIEPDVAVEGGRGRRLDAGDGGAVQLEVLDALIRLVRALVVVDLPVRAGERQRAPSEHLVDGEQLVFPSELAAPGALES